MPTGTRSVIRQAELRKDWPWVRPLVEQVKAKTGEAWLAEDIYSAVSTGKAAMYVSDDPEGVIVLHPSADEWSGDKTLFVWLVYCKAMDQMQDECYALLEQLRQNVGATKIVMHGRPGWQKFGWKVKQVIYERTL